MGERLRPSCWEQLLWVHRLRPPSSTDLQAVRVSNENGGCRWNGPRGGNAQPPRSRVEGARVTDQGLDISDEVRKLGHAPAALRILGGAAFVWGAFLGLGIIAGQMVTQSLFRNVGTFGTFADWTAIVALLVVGRGLRRSKWWAGIGAWVIVWDSSSLGSTGPTGEAVPKRRHPYQTSLRVRGSRGPLSSTQASSSRRRCYRDRRARGFNGRDERTKRPAARRGELDSWGPRM